MKQFFLLMVACVALGLSGCVWEQTAVDYAQRAHPECASFEALNHQLQKRAETEVSMVCGDVTKSITIKCTHGWGILSNTTCHENN
jgi:hypothetical protein